MNGVVLEYVRVLLKGQMGRLSVTASVNRYSQKHVTNLPLKPSVSLTTLYQYLSRHIVQDEV